MLRSALIVDDSRTALLALSRMLKAQNIATDAVESGPEALNLLRRNANPDVIFLDHMMPGMDGFEVLTALKANARTAAIPVVMYTSKEGEVYMGQALTLGAFGVLRKPIDPIELAYILQRVDQLRPSSVGPVRDAAGATVTTPLSRTGAAVTGVIPVPPEFRAQAGMPHAANAGLAPDVTTKPWQARPWNLYLQRALIVFVLLLPTVWYFDRYQQAERMYRQEQDKNRLLQDEQRAAREAAAREAAETKPASPPVVAPQDADLRRERKAQRELLDTVAWALNQNGQYGLNDEPLGDERLVLVRELVARLAAAGFRGSVRLETHVGEFCLVSDEQGGYRLPKESLAISRCEVVTYPPALAEQRGLRQSPAFARYLAERRSSNPIQIVILSHGMSRPLVNYPESTNEQTAGDWNRVAQINQRVEIVLVPAP
jgi:CheY-like chemotaxis protein